MLGTYRDTEVDRSHALGGLLGDIHRSPRRRTPVCAASTADGIEELVAAASGDELDDKVRNLAAALAERTDGNPFFANQVLRHLAERGVLVQDGGRWTVNGSLDDVDLPEGVLDVVGRRLSRLSPAANQALAVAALGGLEFGVRVLCEVPDAGTPDAVVDGLDEAVRARLLVETVPGRFAFTHAIVRDALTRELTIAKRARLHRALGEAILAVYRDAPDVPLAELATTSPRPPSSATPPPRPDGRPPPPPPQPTRPITAAPSPCWNGRWPSSRPSNPSTKPPGSTSPPRSPSAIYALAGDRRVSVVGGRRRSAAAFR